MPSAGAGTITSGYNGSGYANFTFGVNNGSGTFAGVLVNHNGVYTGNSSRRWRRGKSERVLALAAVKQG